MFFSLRIVVGFSVNTNLTKKITLKYIDFFLQKKKELLIKVANFCILSNKELIPPRHLIGQQVKESNLSLLG